MEFLRDVKRHGTNKEVNQKRDAPMIQLREERAERDCGTPDQDTLLA